MATTAMNTYSYSILVKEGIHPPVTMVEDGGEVFPGMPVTCTGETWPDVALPDAAGDSVFGVAGLSENQDIGTVYTDDDEIPVYQCGAGAIVRMYHAGNGGSIVAGDILIAQGVEATGYVEPLSKGFQDCVSGHTSTVMATAITHVYAIVGRAMETHASSGTVTPIKVLLSI